MHLLQLDLALYKSGKWLNMPEDKYNNVPGGEEAIIAPQ